MKKSDKIIMTIEIIVGCGGYLVALFTDSWITASCAVLCLFSAFLIYLFSELADIRDGMIKQAEQYQNFLIEFKEICENALKEAEKKEKENLKEEEKV